MSAASARTHLVRWPAQQAIHRLCLVLLTQCSKGLGQARPSRFTSTMRPAMISTVRSTHA